MNPDIIKIAKSVMEANGYKKPRQLTNHRHCAAFVVWKGRTPYRIEVMESTGLLNLDVFKRVKIIQHSTPLAE